MGVFWPCPATDRDGNPVDHPGTPRLFEPGSWNPVAKGAGPFYFPDGKARFNVADYAPPTEDVDAEYPIILTTGRVVSQFLSGNQTRRIGPLVDQYPEPLLETAPAAGREARHRRRRLGRRSRRRRGAITLRRQVVTTIRPDTVFVPYHWAGREERQPADDRRPGPDLEDPRVQGLRRAACARRTAPPEYAAALEPQQ